MLKNTFFLKLSLKLCLKCEKITYRRHNKRKNLPRAGFEPAHTNVYFGINKAL